MTDSCYIPTKGTTCLHLNYGPGIVVSSDEEYTVIEFASGLKKFVTNIMQLDWAAEVSITFPRQKKRTTPRGPSTKIRCEAPLRRDSTSGFRGVSWSKHNRQWIANIYFEGQNQRLGHFDTAEEASAAYEAARTKRNELVKSLSAK